MVLIVVAVVISLLAGVIIGAVSAVKQNSWFDYTSTGAALLGIQLNCL